MSAVTVPRAHYCHHCRRLVVVRVPLDREVLVRLGCHDKATSDAITATGVDLHDLSTHIDGLVAS